MKQYLNAADVAGIMECSVNHAYKVIRGLNDELKAQGYITRSGRIPAKYFYERAGLGDLQEAHNES